MDKDQLLYQSVTENVILRAERICTKYPTILNTDTHKDFDKGLIYRFMDDVSDLAVNLYQLTDILKDLFNFPDKVNNTIYARMVTKLLNTKDDKGLYFILCTFDKITRMTQHFPEVMPFINKVTTCNAIPVHHDISGDEYTDLIGYFSGFIYIAKTTIKGFPSGSYQSGVDHSAIKALESLLEALMKLIMGLNRYHVPLNKHDICSLPKSSSSTFKIQGNIPQKK